MKKALLYIGIIIVVVEGFFLLNSFIYNEIYKREKEPQLSATSTIAHYKDAEYSIAGKLIKLTNGVSEVEMVSDSASKIITKYFGNEVIYDFNKDGRDDVVFLLTQESGGSGIFYYVVAALNTTGGYVGSQGLLLGDRIAPQTTSMNKEPGKNDVVVVTYADRAIGEPFTTAPSFGKSVWLTFDTQTLQFNIVPQDVLEDIDPSTMTLDMKTWKWMTTTYQGGKEITPRVVGEFTIKFLGKKLSTFSATTDCNNVGGKFSVTDTNFTEDPSITFSDIFSTKKYCANAQESEFIQMLSSAGQFHFTSRGELIIEVNFDTGSMIFK